MKVLDSRQETFRRENEQIGFHSRFDPLRLELACSTMLGVHTTERHNRERWPNVFHNTALMHSICLRHIGRENIRVRQKQIIAVSLADSKKPG